MKKSEAISEKKSGVEGALREIQAKYGEGAIMKLGDARKVDVDVIPTGSLAVDMALEIVESLVRSGSIDVIVIDSVAALTQQAEIEGEMGQSHMGLQARLMSQALRKLTAIIAKSRTVV